MAILVSRPWDFHAHFNLEWLVSSVVRCTSWVELYVHTSSGSVRIRCGNPNFLPVLGSPISRSSTINSPGDDINAHANAEATAAMAAFVKAINAKIRAHPVLNYVCSTRRFMPSSFRARYTRVHRPVIGQSRLLGSRLAMRLCAMVEVFSVRKRFDASSRISTAFSSRITSSGRANCVVPTRTLPSDSDRVPQNIEP